MTRLRDDEIVEGLANAVRALAHAEATGELASLRRLDLDDPRSPSFFRILVRCVPAERHGHDDIRRFALLLAILALRPDGLAGSRRLGHALAEAKVSEARVERLLAARGGTFRDLMHRTARLLARAGELPYRGIGALVLAGDRPHAEELRLGIARDYWSAHDRRQREPAATTEASEG